MWKLNLCSHAPKLWITSTFNINSHKVSGYVHTVQFMRMKIKQFVERIFCVWLLGLLCRAQSYDGWFPNKKHVWVKHSRESMRRWWMDQLAETPGRSADFTPQHVIQLWVNLKNLRLQDKLTLTLKIHNLSVRHGTLSLRDIKRENIIELVKIKFLQKARKLGFKVHVYSKTHQANECKRNFSGGWWFPFIAAATTQSRFQFHC